MTKLSFLTTEVNIKAEVKVEVSLTISQKKMNKTNFDPRGFLELW